MKPAEILRRTQKRLSIEIEMREKTIETLQVLCDLHPNLEVIRAIPSSGELYSTVLELGGGLIEKVEEAQGSLIGEPLVLAQKDNTSVFLPGSSYNSREKYQSYMATRIMPYLFQVSHAPAQMPPGTDVTAEWFVELDDFMVKVKMKILDHGFVVEKTKDPTVPARLRRFFFEPPAFMEGYDHVQWWTPGDTTNPADRTYFRLDAHGWEG